MVASTPDRTRVSIDGLTEWSLIVFTRWPTPGRTKTRLIPAYGAGGAASIHQQLIAHTVAVARTLPVSVNVVVAIADAPSGVDKKLLFGDWTCIEQRGTDLGDRMANAIDEIFSMHQKSTSTVLIGVDCPDYSTELLEQAASALLTKSITYAPTEDGGYGLVGVRRSAWNPAVRDAMFQGIEWGSSSVMQSSLARLNSIEASVIATCKDALTITMLSALWDVDTPADVERAVADGVVRF
jgi:uncharacterized protein